MSDIQITFTLRKFHCKNLQWKYIKNENHNLGSEEQKTLFPVVSRLHSHFGFGRLLLACPIGRARKFEVNLSRPDKK